MQYWFSFFFFIQIEIEILDRTCILFFFFWLALKDRNYNVQSKFQWIPNRILQNRNKDDNSKLIIVIVLMLHKFLFRFQPRWSSPTIQWWKYSGFLFLFSEIGDLYSYTNIYIVQIQWYLNFSFQFFFSRLVKAFRCKKEKNKQTKNEINQKQIECEKRLCVQYWIEAPSTLLRELHQTN